jgi:hypothetical protein
MTYASNGLIEASDFGTALTTGRVGCVNAVWGATLGNTFGYGQTNVAAVASSTVVSAANWSELIQRLESARRHQTGGSVGAGLTAPTPGTLITFLNTLDGVISTATAERFSTGGVYGPSVSSTPLSNSTGWTTTRQLETAITWSSGAAAMRYFFNAGGYIQFTGWNSSLSGNTKSNEWKALLGDPSNTTGCGVIRIFGLSSDRISGSGNVTVYNTGLGYHNLGTATGQYILRQYTTNTLGGYNLNYAEFSARLNGAVGTANQLIVNMNLVDAAGDVVNDTVTGTVTLNVTVVPPRSTADTAPQGFLANTWGAVTFTNTITG